MVTCSPRVGIKPASQRQARFRRHIEKPPQAIPARAMTQVEGSGTAATRKPMLTSPSVGS